jgi:hypothetical protein
LREAATAAGGRISALVTHFEENQLSAKLKSTRAGTAIADSLLIKNMQVGYEKKFLKKIATPT